MGTEDTRPRPWHLPWARASRTGIGHPVTGGSLGLFFTLPLLSSSSHQRGGVVSFPAFYRRADRGSEHRCHEPRPLVGKW